MLLGLLSLPALLMGEVVAGFDDLSLTELPVEAYTGPGGGVYYNGGDGAGGFSSGGVQFETTFTDFGTFTSWNGWAYSTTTDAGTPGFGNQYSSFAGGAADGAGYGVAYVTTYPQETPAVLKIPGSFSEVISVEVTNTTYAALVMRDGDAGFGLEPYGDGDFLKLVFTAYDTESDITGAVEFYLADFREETDPNYIVSDWTTVDLTPLNGGTEGAVSEIRLTFESSDVGDFGINTPTYAAVDNLVLAGGWGGYPLSAGGWADTGSFLGWVYPQGDWVWIGDAQRWVYLPEPGGDSPGGEWVFVPGS